MIVRGKRNRSKLKVLIVLDQHGRKGQAGLNVYSLALRSGVSHDYVEERIRFWWSWHFITRELGIDICGYPCFYYRIAAKGRRAVASTSQVTLDEVGRDLPARGR